MQEKGDKGSKDPNGQPQPGDGDQEGENGQPQPGKSNTGNQDLYFNITHHLSVTREYYA